ncbi:MAG: adenosylcobalamin-dependent ribonucleoside-diphosphate reductase [Gammaproteobacteria bacterium]|nr:adenosylcobalamin-dependent ribonucleoside-diphosphate reductase [Gammaproteobacteria bacterium]
MQPASWDIWDKKYRLKDKDGKAIDVTLEHTYIRIAHALAEVENPSKRDYWFQHFLWALQNGAIPAGRIVSNAGAKEYKPTSSTINCTVSGQIHDSMGGILSSLYESGMTLKAGCGIGYDFSSLRPRGAFVAGAGANTSGPLSFMDVFDAMCKTISSAGDRRGAQMATFDISHPDIVDFIRSKREDGRLRQFNLSCLISDDFIEAVKEDSDWLLVFPASPLELDNPATEIVYCPWPITNGQRLDADNNVACRVYHRIRARRLWDDIMTSTYDFAEPGFILIDKVNRMNNNWFCENIRATNPCGEQPLPPHGSCLLGSINLTRFVKNPFTSKAEFDWNTFSDIVKTFTRMLDNAIATHGLPWGEQASEILHKRRHGMGFLGLGSAITMLGMTYGDKSSVALTEEISRKIAIIGWRVGIKLGEEKGVAPIMDEMFTIDKAMLTKQPRLAEDGHKLGDSLPGRVLIARYGRYFEQFPEPLREAIAEKGARFTHHTSIAPTGTISLSLANNASAGIEPSFAHKYSRNVIQEGKKSKEKVDVLSYELLTYRDLVNPDADPDSDDEANHLPSYFVDANSISPTKHIDIQAAAQKWIDSSISKTINVPQDYPYDKFKKIYLYAHEKGLKGCTTFRFNPEVFQGVLVQDKDLEKTTYRFALDDGSTVEMQGNETVIYDGEEHTAANLYDALKEGYYGKL